MTKPSSLRRVLLLGAGLLAVSGAPASAQSTVPDVTLYELMSNTTLTGAMRSETAELSGYARPGTSLCPSSLVGGACVINLSIKSSLDVTTGQGTATGTFSLVAQGDNPVDGWEAVVTTGTFSGTLDFTSLTSRKLPYGLLSGTLSLTDPASRISISGVVRVPFDGQARPSGARSSARQTFCPMSTGPNAALGGPDLAWPDVGIGDLLGTCTNVSAGELGIGRALTRVDLYVTSKSPFVVTAGPCPSSTGAPKTVSFRNNRRGPVRLYTVDGACREVFHQTISPRSTVNQYTFVGRPWRARNTAGVLVNETVVGSKTKTVVITP